MRDQDIISRIKEVQKEIDNIKKVMELVFEELRKLNVISNGNRMVIQNLEGYEEAFEKVKKQLHDKEEQLKEEEKNKLIEDEENKLIVD